MNNFKNDEGWEDSGRNNETYTHPDHVGLYGLIKGENGKDYIKDYSGAYNGLEEYDPKKHGWKR